MILVDTNVVSELVRAEPATEVVQWLNRQSALTLHVSAVSVAELRFGIDLLERGHRKRRLEDAVDGVLAEMFDDRILPFDQAGARVFGTLVAEARRRGRPVSTADAQIAATASRLSYTVATRDHDPFEAMGVPVIDPWRSA